MENVKNAKKTSTKLYLMWTKKDEVVMIKAINEAEAVKKVKKNYPKFAGKVTCAEWGDKYACVSDISDSILAKNGIQPRCHKCDCLVPIDNFKQKHGRAYCDKCY